MSRTAQNMSRSHAILSSTTWQRYGIVEFNVPLDTLRDNGDIIGV